MKQIITIVLAFVATVCLGGKVNAQQYGLHFQDISAAYLNDGDTVYYHTTDDDAIVGLAYISFYIDNLTDQPVLTDNEVTMIEGPDGMETELCAGGNCPQQGPYILQPGQNELMPLTIEPQVVKQFAGDTLLYRVKVGNVGLTNNVVTVYLRVYIASNVGIESVENPQALMAYPNPTKGRVTVGDREYDLSGRPAGVYFLPGNGSPVRVIKL